MDKFAVDLDQVLNDFEYSELTDQYGATRNTSASTQNSCTHSINNVFHSLNEYLTTNIDITNSKIHKTSGEDTVTVSKYSEEMVGDPGITLTDKYDLKQYNAPYNEKLDGEEDFDDHVDVDQAENIRNTNKELVETVTVSPESGKINNSEKGMLLKGDSVISDDHIFKNVNNKGPIIDDNKKNYEYSEFIRPKKILNEPNTKTEVKNNEMAKKGKVIDNLEVIESVDSDVKHSVVEAVVNDQISGNELYLNKSVDTCSTIGFVDDLNLDDMAINQLLAELEDEFSNEKDIEQTSQVYTIDEDRAETVIADIEIKDTRHGLNHMISPIQDSIGEDASDKADESNNVDVTETLNKKKYAIDNEAKKNTCVTESQPLPEISVEKNGEHTQTNVKANVDNSKIDVSTLVLSNSSEVDGTIQIETSNTAIDIDNNASKQEGLEDSCDSSSRPQNLFLKENNGDSQREINLIGNPGSTPYNNIYVREEIHKQQGYHRDSDASSSSDSFSDASSTASTASTEEVKDERDLNVEDVENSAITKNATGSVDDPSEVTNDSSSIVNDEQNRNPVENSDLPVDSEDVTEDRESESVTLTCASPSVEYEHLLENIGKEWLGKRAPLWIPDADATTCLHCDMKFTVLKRRHHCRACGLVLCSKCCHLRFKLDYMDGEARVCNKCHDILNQDSNSSSSSDRSPENGNSPSHRPNPNNPAEYCSTVSPLEQTAGSNVNPPAVMVPVGVLKRKGCHTSDGITPVSSITSEAEF